MEQGSTNERHLHGVVVAVGYGNTLDDYSIQEGDSILFKKYAVSKAQARKGYVLLKNKE
ncbi:hypothetical protein BJY04DRAFT_214838 [Aspergillus karnatakaensis]|uniref:uncharacterized protein n=1 Tax=Aspergillus karnatakaensis TaxID=1810916 RepID=UPI003CCC987C